MKTNVNPKPSLSFLLYQTKLLEYTPLPKSFAKILGLISALQSTMLSILGFTMILRASNTNLDKYLRAISEYSLGLLYFNIEDLSIIARGIFTFIGIYLLGMVILVAFAAVSVKMRRQLPILLANYTVPLLQLHFFVFFVPILNILCSGFFQIISSETLRNRGGCIVAMVFLILGILFNSLLGGCLFLTTIKLRDRDSLARMSDFGMFNGFIQKLILTILFWAYEHNIAGRSVCWIYNIIACLVFLIRMAHMVDTPVFFSNRLNRILHCETCLSSLVSVWNFITLISNIGRDRVLAGHLITIILLLYPFALNFYLGVIESRKQDIFFALEHPRRRKFLAAQHIMDLRFLLAEQEINKKEKRVPEKDLKETLYRIKDRNIQEITTKPTLGKYLYDLTTKKKLPTLLELIIAETLALLCDCWSQSYLICNSILSRENITHTEKLTALIIRGTIQDLIHKHQLENAKLVVFMNSVNNHDELGSQVHQAVVEREIFYTLLSKEEQPSIYELSKCSKRVQMIERKINSIKLPKLKHEYFFDR